MTESNAGRATLLAQRRRQQFDLASDNELSYDDCMNTSSISRRRFAGLLVAGAAAAVIKPAASARQPGGGSIITGVVRLSANENPYGPSLKALHSMNNAFGLAGRYPDEQNDLLIAKLAKMNGVEADQILLGDGSGEILKLCAETFTGKELGKLVVADPTFEAILNYSTVAGAEVEKIPLRPNFGHDLSKMLNAATGGLVYICNPNNPTASITPRNEVREFISKTSTETKVLVDEAYFHYADTPDYESAIPLVRDHQNLIVARTFSKIYGMAGLRCGYCVAHKETIDQLRSHQPWDSVNIMALTAASASLDDVDQVANGRKLNNEAKAFTTAALDQLGYECIPAQANFIMFDCTRPVVPLIKALKDRSVAVGRLFPAMPNHMRLTIGKKSEMERFLSVFRQVMAS
jgi:histidinol-phosphate aminotransferase